MKEGISYTFLLNIIIIFIVVCAAIVMGIFSYYKAFRANTIISQAIEKFEGYNCESKEEIATKLNNISYNTPFEVKCKNGEKQCEVDENSNYKIISYNLNISSGDKYAGQNEMSSIVNSNNSESTKTYQYGIYTYMYFDVPIISKIIKFPFFTKTDIMYEFRNLKYDADNDTVYDERNIPKQYADIEEFNNNFRNDIRNEYVEGQRDDYKSNFLNIDSTGYEAKERAKIDTDDNGKITIIDSGKVGESFKNYYESYGKCNGEPKIYENY